MRTVLRKQSDDVWVYRFSLVTFLVVVSSTFLSLGTGARLVPSGKWTGFYSSHLYPVMLALVSYSHDSCGVVEPIFSLHFLLVHRTMLCLGWTEMSAHSLSLVPISSRFHLHPWECSWQMGSPCDCDAFCRAHTEGSLWSPALWGALCRGRKGWCFSCEAYLTLMWIVRGWPTSAWWGFGSIFPWEKILLPALFLVGRMQPLYRNSLRPFMNGTSWIITFQSFLKLLIGLVV